MQLYYMYCVQASLSVVRNSEVVHYSGAAIVLGYRYIEQCPLLGRGPLSYWKCPLTESPL